MVARSSKNLKREVHFIESKRRNQNNLLLGIIGNKSLSLLFAFGIIVWFKAATFIPWAGELAMCLIPFSIIIGMVWQADSTPAPADKIGTAPEGIISFIVKYDCRSGSCRMVDQDRWGLRMPPPTPRPHIFHDYDSDYDVLVRRCVGMLAGSRH